MSQNTASHWTLLIALAIVALAFLLKSSPNNSASDALEYQGVKFHLSRQYGDYDDFKEDQQNFTPDQFQRIASLLKNAPAPATFRNAEELIRFIFELKVPGYGVSSSLTTTPSGDLNLEQIEIPNLKQERVLVYFQRSKNDPWIRVDDFIANDDLHLAKAEIVGKKIHYLANDLTTVLRQTNLPD